MKVVNTSAMIMTGQLIDRLAGAFRVSGMVVSSLEEETTVTLLRIRRPWRSVAVEAPTSLRPSRLQRPGHRAVSGLAGALGRSHLWVITERANTPQPPKPASSRPRLSPLRRGHFLFGLRHLPDSKRRALLTQRAP